MYTHSHITHNSLPLHFSHIFCSLLNYQQCCTVNGTRHYVPIMYTLCTPLRQVHNITHTHTLTTNHTDGVNATARLQPSNRKQPVSRAVYTHMHTTISTAHTHTRTAHLTQPERTAREGAFGKAWRRRRQQRRQQRPTYALANEPNLIEHCKIKNENNNNMRNSITNSK